MEVRKGYKRTEVGVIPGEWEVKKLGHISNMKSGDSITSKSISKYARYPCYGGNGLRGYTFRYTHDGEFTLIGRQGALCGNIEYVRGKFFASEHAVVVRPGTDIDIKWLTYKLIYLNLNQYSESSAQPGLSVSKISDLVIVIPREKKEQAAIATALSDVDDLISSLKELIAKKKKIKRGAMQGLLTGKKRLPSFSGEWEEISIEEIGILTGAGVDKKNVKGEDMVFLLNYLDVYNRSFINKSMLNQVVTANNQKIESCNIKKGDIFFTPTSEIFNDIARSAIALEDMDGVVYSYHVVRLRPFKGFHNMFLNYAFKTTHFENQANMFSEGSGTRYVITLKRFNKLTAKIPTDVEEQTAIATILTDMDAEIEALEQKLNKYQALKQGMMEELLTGKIRLV